LIKAPIEKYPNVAVDADRAGSSTNNSLDQATTYGISLYVEFMVKSVKGPEEASARAQRMLDAINICIMSNRTLRGTIQELDDAPTAQLSDVFTRREKTSYGNEWFWRGGRLEYVPKKVAAMPSGDFLRSASISAIDQA
jgi:small nuclear ribonucleoprotein (snRNP)-like protein